MNIDSEGMALIFLCILAAIIFAHVLRVHADALCHKRKHKSTVILKIMVGEVDKAVVEVDEDYMVNTLVGPLKIAFDDFQWSGGSGNDDADEGEDLSELRRSAAKWERARDEEANDDTVGMEVSNDG